MKNITKFLLGLILFSTTPLIAQDKKDDSKWDVSNPPGDWNWKEVSFTTNEGTWMNLDVSPNGRTIVFDMLGDIYTLPINGGKAKAIRSGLAWECQPRFSPDGKKILFTSDAGGGDNIWVMNADGEEAKQLTKEDFRLLSNPYWTPDGNYFVARKHFTSSRSLGAGEMWLYHITGGSGIQLTERKNDQQDVNEPCISPDGKYVYFSEDMYPGGNFQYNKDPNNQIYVVRRYDREKGKIENVVTGPGGACRPQVSNDGKQLAFVRRVRTKTALFVQDLETGIERMLTNNLSKDQQEAWAIFGVYTGFDWSPDDKEIIIWANGKINKVKVEDGSMDNIPFIAGVNQKVAETIRFNNKAFDEKVDVNVLRNLQTGPDNKTLVFNAVGHLWKATLPDTKATRITNDTYLEFEPAFSKDGKKLVYVTWEDEKMGQVLVLDLASGSKTILTSEKGIYRNPSFSPDGKWVVFEKDGGNNHQGYIYCKEPGLYLCQVNNPEPKRILDHGEFPVFSEDGNRIYFQTGGFIFGSITKAYGSVKTDGTDEQKHFEGKYAQKFSISPDNNWVAWSELYKVYIAPFPKTGKTFGLDHNTKAVPVAQVAKDAGINLHWSADSKRLHWTLGNEYFSDDLTERFLFLEGSRDSVPPMDSTGIEILVEIKADKPEGQIAFTNARIITMEGDQVLENATLLVEGNTIKAIGGDVKYPKSAKVIDCTGKTIMPGMVDVHGHLGNFRYGLSPQKQWEYYANLAYGVTTAHDPSSNSEMIFSQSEMIKAGEMVGPRLFSTGTILYGADGDFKAVVNSLEDAKSAIRRTKAYGAFSVKSYNQPRRDQRQQVLEAARELGIIVVPEGGSFFYHNMTQVIDGHTGIEHNIPVAPLYKDVIQLWSKTNTHNTPTLIVNYGSVNGEYYWYQKTDVWEKSRLLNFTPRPVVDSRARHRTMIPDKEYENGHILTSQSCTKLQDSGVNVNLGAHGQLQGLGAHWELWMLAQGGMSNHQALKCATINGAKYLGMEAQIGSLKAGKLADLVIMDKNPLEDIQNSESIRFTMINGRLYDSETMNETGNYDKKRSKFFFEQPGGNNSFPYYETTGSCMMPSCVCGQ
jgi:imidazolonepropionase-like amidohydrolase/Tol biopolymer transport system component